MSICKNRKSVNSFSEAFHQTPSIPPNYYSSSSAAGDLDSGGEGPVALLNDFGLMSCTESLGFESSDEISTVEYDRRCNENDDDSLSSTCSSSSSSASSCSFYGYDNSRVKRWRSSRRRTETEKRSFPPPLTSMSENGRRNFMLKPIRKDGRLEIVGVRIECPEILCATRCNGRLTMRFVKSVLHEQDEDEDEETEDVEERENDEVIEELGEGKTEEERENGEFVEEGKTEEEEEEEKEFEEFLVEEETEEAEEEEEVAEEERAWKFPATAAGLRRCYHRHELHVWGQQQQRCVTSM